LAAVLREDPEGFLLLLQGRHPHAAVELRRRFEKTLAGVHERVLFLPAQDPVDYRRLLSLADVFLDSPHYSAGFTGYDAFSLGLTIVTLPDGFGMGNYVRGFYRKIGLEHLVARTPEEYVNQAVRLGTDREYRESVRSLIGGRRDALFEDLYAVREYERFFEGAITRARGADG
jgi:predicted O-linked N-acetylglucosamine transferase (SPINDLY family)